MWELYYYDDGYKLLYGVFDLSVKDGIVDFIEAIRAIGEESDITIQEVEA